MLEVVSRGFTKARERFKGIRELNEENIQGALKDIRLSLLEADVHVSVVKQFIEDIKQKAIGEAVETRVSHKGRKLKVSPSDHFINICYEELVSLMGPVDTGLAYNKNNATTIMLVGLQGCGKTTTAGKLARYLISNSKKPLLVAADIYRPAAVEQLQIIASSLQVPVYTDANKSPDKICRQAMDYASEQGCNAVIFDTAGRLAIDETLMAELDSIADSTKPDNTILVCDAMIGQDAVKTAEAFNSRLDLSGFILTKLDGDARGGAALSIRQVTGKPIKFLGMGETLGSLEEFRPEGLASRILGYGDVVGLMKDFEEVVDEKKAEEDALKMLKGQFNLIDFLEQIQSIKKMGPLQDLVEKIPFFSQAAGNAVVDDRELVKVESIINSMTPHERSHPEVLNDSRKKRIAKGAGRSLRDISELLKRFKTMKSMMKNMGARGGLLSKLSSGMSGIPGLGQGIAGDVSDADFSQDMGQLPKKLNTDARKKLKKKRKLAKKARKKGKKK